MKKLNLTIAAVLILLASACQKDDITPLKPDVKKHIIECRQCTGSWDITDSSFYPRHS